MPDCYRKHFPLALKSHRSHDIVLLCIDCHMLAHTAAERLRRMFAQRFDVPLHPSSKQWVTGPAGGTFAAKTPSSVDLISVNRGPAAVSTDEEAKHDSMEGKGTRHRMPAPLGVPTPHEWDWPTMAEQEGSPEHDNATAASEEGVAPTRRASPLTVRKSALILEREKNLPPNQRHALERTVLTCDVHACACQRCDVSRARVATAVGLETAGILHVAPTTGKSTSAANLFQLAISTLPILPSPRCRSPGPGPPQANLKEMPSSACQRTEACHLSSGQ